MDRSLLAESFDRALPYERYLESDRGRAEAWRRVESQVRLSPSQHELVRAFTRRMCVLVVSGIWCGDCSAQGPMLHAIARGNTEMIDLRWVDRDEHPRLADMVRICGGHRVPTVIFMAEDLEFVSILGDRTLSRYRALAARQLGPNCPVPGAPIPQDELDATLADWLDEFERVHLVLRLSPRLRALHGD